MIQGALFGSRLIYFLRPIRRLACYLTAFAFLVSISACTYTRLHRQLNTLSEFGRLDKGSPFLKVHMLDGRVYVLSQWKESEGDRQVTGHGSLLDFNRNLIQQGDFAIPLEGIVLFETNVIRPSPVITSLAVLTGVSLGFTFYCLSNPKACFGSCPTIYAWEGSSMTLQAEGFSASIAPSLEAKDVDALYLARPSSSLLELMVTNEALETHVIRSAHVLAAPKPESGRVFMTAGGEFWRTSEIREPTRCRSPEGDVLEKIRSFDGVQRSSEADPRNLATKETLEFVFDTVPGEASGLILGFRQTLLTTYLFYQGLAYLGDASGLWLAQLARGDEKARQYSEGPGRYLGGIDVYLENRDGHWVRAGECQETGPIATNIQLIPLPKSTSPQLKVRLRLTKGLWRLDYIALGTLEGKEEPIRISPAVVVHQKVSEFGGGNDPAGLEAKWPIVTLPGDVYSLSYELPGDYAQYELFVETQGYYLEWMRESWLKEKNLGQARLMLTNPAKFLRQMAPEYKKVESGLDEIFWRSRYAKTTTR
jgi:hypothetical protein